MSRTRTRDTTTTTAASSTSEIYTEPPHIGESLFLGNIYSTTPTTVDWSHNFTGFASKTGVIETMVDEESGSGSYNEVDHRKERWSCPIVVTNYDGKDARNNYYPALSHTTTRCSCGDDQVSFWIDNWPTSWDSATNALVRATNLLQFDVQTSGFNLPIFLGELRDFRHILDAVTGRFRRTDKGSTRKGLRQIKYLLRRYKERPIIETLSALASADLFYQFAIKPLISDLKQLMNLGVHLDAQAVRLQRVEPQVAVSSVVDRGDSRFENDVFDTAHDWATDYNYERLITAWCLFRYNPDETWVPPSATRVALDALNVASPLETSWELTPWSFLVDYFVDIGGFLNNFNGQIVNMPVEIVQEAYSIKETAESLCTLSLDSGPFVDALTSLEDTPVTVTGALKKTRYRRIKLPLPFGAIAYPTVQLPNLRQVRNILDLVFLRSVS